MLTIRKEQIAVFDENLRNRFQDRMVSHITAKYPKQCNEWGERRTREFVIAGIEKAVAHGIATEGAIKVMIELMVEVGSGLEYSPDRNWANNILTHPAIPGYVKVDLIQERIRSRTQGRVIVPHRREAR